LTFETAGMQHLAFPKPEKDFFECTSLSFLLAWRSRFFFETMKYFWKKEKSIFCLKMGMKFKKRHKKLI